MILSGTLLTPTGQPYKNEAVRLTAKETSEQVLKAAVSYFKTDDDGLYSVDVPYGRYTVEVFEHFNTDFIGSITVDADATETDINSLIILEQTATPTNPFLQEIRESVVEANTAAATATTQATNASTSAEAALTSKTAAEAAATNSAASATESEAAATQAAASAQGTIDLTQALTLNSMAQLKALDTTKFTRADTRGYYTAGDGGKGSYLFVATLTPPTNNNCTVIHSDDGLGYWKLLLDGTLNVKQAGAKQGIDCSQSFRDVVSSVLASDGEIGKVVFNSVAGGRYTVSYQVLFNCENITYVLEADIYNTSTVYQVPLVFAHSILEQPLANLNNVTIVGNGYEINGNGAAIKLAMGITQDGVLPPTFARPMCNYIDNLTIEGVDFNDGVYDSLGMRQCRNHKLSRCIFRGATQYLANGLNATTNWSTYIRGDYRTYSYGVVEDCIAYGNASMGMTYYHCSGGVTRRGICFNNGWNNGSGGSGSGFSYESPPGPFSIKYADGRYESCIAYNNGINGWYINTPGVFIDEKCASMGNGVLGILNDVSNLQMCGVVVVGVDEVTVLGSHKANARHGVSFLGATGLQPTWKCGGDYQDNIGSGVNIQGIYRGGVLPGTLIARNGRGLIGGQNLPALSVTNAVYNNGAGRIDITGINFESNGARDINIGNVRYVTVANCTSFNPNDVRTTTGGTGYNFGAIGVLQLRDNFLDVVGNGWTTNGYVIGNDVTALYQKSNKSNQVSGTVMLNSASTKFGISGATRMNSSTHTVKTTLPATGTATLNDVADVLATLLDSLKDGVMQG